MNIMTDVLLSHMSQVEECKNNLVIITNLWLLMWNNANIQEMMQMFMWKNSVIYVKGGTYSLISINACNLMEVTKWML